EELAERDGGKFFGIAQETVLKVTLAALPERAPGPGHAGLGGACRPGAGARAAGKLGGLDRSVRWAAHRRPPHHGRRRYGGRCGRDGRRWGRDRRGVARHTAREGVVRADGRWGAG